MYARAHRLRVPGRDGIYPGVTINYDSSIFKWNKNALRRVYTCFMVSRDIEITEEKNDFGGELERT